VEQVLFAPGLDAGEFDPASTGAGGLYMLMFTPGPTTTAATPGSMYTGLSPLTGSGGGGGGIEA